MKVKPASQTQEEKDIALTDCSVDEEENAFVTISAVLLEIRKLQGVLGYILRSNTSAIIDLDEQERLIEYALFSFQAHEAGAEIAKQFSLGGVESVLVEGQRIKVLCMDLGENRISLFMQKDATHDGIIRRILL